VLRPPIMFHPYSCPQQWASSDPAQLSNSINDFALALDIQQVPFFVPVEVRELWNVNLAFRAKWSPVRPSGTDCYHISTGIWLI
jgi:hypothetical protein